MTDISETLAPKSDQLDAIELEPGPRIFQIAQVDVHKGSEQPVSIHLVGFPRVWRPSKTQRRLLANRKIWNTTDGKAWVGRWVELTYDPSIKYAGEAVGGIVVSRVSDIEKPQEVRLPASQTTTKLWRVAPLPLADILRAEWKTADPDRRKAIEAQVTELEVKA